MILKALYDYYQNHPELPRLGLEKREFKYWIVIRDNGDFVRLENLCRDDQKKRGPFFQVAQSVKRSGKLSWQKANMLWDHYGYVLGYHQLEKDVVAEAKKADLTRLQHQQFIAQLKTLPENLRQLREVRAVLEFYRKGHEAEVFASPEWEECAAVNGCNLTFCLEDQSTPVCSHFAVCEYAGSLADDSADAVYGRCLITGKRTNLCRLMDPVAIPGAKPGTSLVSFQIYKGYDSYGKKNCFNGPMGRDASFACTAALNALLAKDSRSKLQIGDTTFVFWSETPLKSFSLESLMAGIVQNAPQLAGGSCPDWEKISHGNLSDVIAAEDQTVRYYILGLAPNVARISIRFWQTGVVPELLGNIARHYCDMKIDDTPAFPPLSSLLAVSVYEHATENIISSMTEKIFEAILTDGKYPDNLIQFCLRRICEDGAVSPLRASILKAYVNRKSRIEKKQEKEITMIYSPENSDVAYQCGALFAVLVRAQEEAKRTTIAPIKGRYFATASTRPATAFATLLKLNQETLNKLHPGRAVLFEKMLGDLVEKIGSCFPSYLSFQEQGRFCLGYYQRHNLFFEDKKHYESKEA